MILSDSEILRLMASGRLSIRPFDESQLTPNGVDLAVGEEAMIMDGESSGRRLSLGEGSELEIPPCSHVLVATREYLEIPPDVVGLVNLRSTYARKGLVIPPTVVDAGYKGRLTLAIRGAPYPLRVAFGERIWHLVLVESHKASRPYSGKYQGSLGLVAAPKRGRSAAPARPPGRSARSPPAPLSSYRKAPCPRGTAPRPCRRGRS